MSAEQLKIYEGAYRKIVGCSKINNLRGLGKFL
jgi:hypothetical protein